MGFFNSSEKFKMETTFPFFSPLYLQAHPKEITIVSSVLRVPLGIFLHYISSPNRCKAFINKNEVNLSQVFFTLLFS